MIAITEDLVNEMLANARAAADKLAPTVQNGMAEMTEDAVTFHRLKGQIWLLSNLLEMDEDDVAAYYRDKAKGATIREMLSVAQGGESEI